MDLLLLQMGLVLFWFGIFFIKGVATIYRRPTHLLHPVQLLNFAYNLKLRRVLLEVAEHRGRVDVVIHGTGYWLIVFDWLFETQPADWKQGAAGEVVRVAPSHRRKRVLAQMTAGHHYLRVIYMHFVEWFLAAFVAEAAGAYTVLGTEFHGIIHVRLNVTPLILHSIKLIILEHYFQLILIVDKAERVIIALLILLSFPTSSPLFLCRFELCIWFCCITCYSCRSHLIYLRRLRGWFQLIRHHIFFEYQQSIDAYRTFGQPLLFISLLPGIGLSSYVVQINKLILPKLKYLDFLHVHLQHFFEELGGALGLLRQFGQHQFFGAVGLEMYLKIILGVHLRFFCWKIILYCIFNILIL